jgi:single-stranded DNA-binding protein
VDYNTVTIVGRLAGKPVLKGYTKKDGTAGFRAFMRVAVTRLSDLGRKREERRTNFVPVVCWGPLAQRCAEYLDKGTEVTIGGELIAESRAIEGTNPVEYREFIHLQANTVQFGRRSQKNATPEQLLAEAKALQSRIDSAASGSQPAEAAIAGGQNPFEQS